MAIIAPFRALRYNPASVGRMEDVVTPPYDVIDSSAQAALNAKSPYNMIHLDLSKNIEPTADLDERYLQSKRLLEKWQAEGVLIRDPSPAIYLYHIDYTHPSGRRLTRRGLVALTQLAEFSEGIVKPHEKTFRGVISDRLRLLDTCQTQFSQIFSLYPDRDNAVMAVLEAARPAEPFCSASDADGGRHTIWAVTEPGAIAAAEKLFRDKALYIADGHHRYTTALQLREVTRERLGGIDAASPYNYTMMYLCGMDDPGLSVLPTHRLVRAPGAWTTDRLVERLSAVFSVEHIVGGSREVLVAEVLGRMEERRDQTMFGLYHATEDRCCLLTLQEDKLPADFTATHPAELADLDVVVLSDLVLARLLDLDHARCEEEGLVDYFSDPDEAIDVAVKESGRPDVGTPLIFLMNPTLVSQVREVADAGLVMPHKSTYFYPKILTGLLMNQLVAGESVGT